MKALVLLFWQMLRFKRSPEDTPYSAALLLFIIAVNFILAATAQAVGRPSQLNIAIFSPVIAICVELLFIYLLLQLKNKQKTRQINRKSVQWLMLEVLRNLYKFVL